MRKITLSILFAITLYCQPSSAQMEKRMSELFDAKKFLETKPTVGDSVVNLKLKTLAGESTFLYNDTPTNLIVIKGSYT